jgi:hypothetical protein
MGKVVALLFFFIAISALEKRLLIYKIRCGKRFFAKKI